MSHFTGTWREGRKLVLNRVLALGKIDIKRKRGFESAQSRGNKEGIATARSWALFRWKGRGIAVSIELWAYSSFNREGG